MEVEFKNLEKEETHTVNLDEKIYGTLFNESLVHQVVKTYITNGKPRTKAQKSRSQIRGGGAKPWRQKGTGRARAGSRRSPLWTGGAVHFAAIPHKITKKLNKKMYKNAIKSILSELARQKRLIVIDELQVSEPKTKALKQKLQQIDKNNLLIVTEKLNENLHLAARNLTNIKLVKTNEMTPLDLIYYEATLVTQEAQKKLEELLG